MNRLNGSIVSTSNLTGPQIDEMFRLMDLFYAHMDFTVFLKDLSNKDYCILLTKEDGAIAGFSTQRLLSFPVSGHMIHGVFSGDTIIHRDYWGSQELFLLFARFFFEYGRQFDHFYWFLISKGYKTYKLLPTFFREFYPNCREETPLHMKEIMDAFGSLLYPEEYENEAGVIAYGREKDTLKPGVADITEGRSKDRDIAFFIRNNPFYYQGNDLVCITDLKRENLKKGVADHIL